ncbi:MAG TPA: rhodanese-like domain-containing protein [Gemmatimonadaceae bacterium]|nr:rhodanese-like domain-containing protein [Gemmatimonadaceae bacterium]
MLLKRVYDPKLAQASYLIGCQATGEAIVIDPNRDIEQYVNLAEEEGLRITHVSETHIHADFVSGARELASTTGAQLYLSDEGDADWKYAFAKEAGARLVSEGDEFMVGNLRFQVMHTPGHTPEHISFLLTDTPATDRPIGIFTGDFVFVGDVGRPDLLEKAAKVMNTMEAGARTLFRSLQRFKELPDHLQIWPGHGAGSACGKALGAVPQSTLGYENIANWGLRAENEEEFVAGVLAGQPEPPKYFAEMKRINKEGPPILGGFHRPERLTLSQLEQRHAAGEMVVDTRPAAEFGAGHIPGTINIPLNKSFNTWAGWLVPYDREFSLIVHSHDDHSAIDEAVRDLALIGLDAISGHFSAEIVGQWRAAGGELATVPQISPTELNERLEAGEVAVIDVRGRSEWEEAHLPGVANIPVGYLTERLDEIPRDRPVVVHCQSGSRSAIAASVLHAHGVTNVINLSGGIVDWRRSGRPVESGQPEQTLAGAT